ncbi:MAG TPA: TraB/GumN family protein [Verrucomicrobiales bacterium]|nr:TraB/GumN family protein [Verrucomicrobiales bacterium]
MKLLVAGLVLITFSGVALLWRNGLDRVEKAPAVAAGPERTTRCMVWKAERGKATVWICGSIHLLRETDYPLPEPYLHAFSEAKTLVMEHDRTREGQGRQDAQQAAALPKGETLEKKVSPETWTAFSDWCRRSGTDLNTMQPLKAWSAATFITLINLQHLGYSAGLGMENYFVSSLAARKTAGLETLQEQLAVFDRLDAKTQENMILQAIAEEKNLKARSAAMAAAWHEGNATLLSSLMEKNMHEFPDLKKRLQDDRNLAWIPKIEALLDGQETVMILAGSGHLAGSGSVIDLLEKKGVKVTQMEYKTTRPLIPSAGNTPEKP